MREGDRIGWPWVAVGFTVFILLAGLAGRSDYEDAVREEQLYCANVALYKATEGLQGWPDYRDVYNTMCVRETKKVQNS